MFAAAARRVDICFKNTNSCHWRSLIVVLPKSLQKIKDLIGASFHTPTKQNIREIPIHMWTIISFSNVFLGQSSLSEEQFNLRNNQLLEVFPEEGRTLLKRLYEISVIEYQRIATTKLLYLLSFDATVRSLLPFCLLQPLERLCNDICSGNIEEF